MGEPATTWQFWLPPLSGLVLWPWLFLLLDRLRIGRRTHTP
jgi:rod shape-determining protein MreD